MGLWGNVVVKKGLQFKSHQESVWYVPSVESHGCIFSMYFVGDVKYFHGIYPKSVVLMHIVVYMHSTTIYIYFEGLCMPSLSLSLPFPEYLLHNSAVDDWGQIHACSP